MGVMNDVLKRTNKRMHKIEEKLRKLTNDRQWIATVYCPNCEEDNFYVLDYVDEVDEIVKRDCKHCNHNLVFHTDNVPVHVTYKPG